MHRSGHDICGYSRNIEHTPPEFSIRVSQKVERRPARRARFDGQRSLGDAGSIRVLNARGSTFYSFHVPSTFTFNAPLGYKFNREAPRVLANTAIRVGVAIPSTKRIRDFGFSKLHAGDTHRLAGRTGRLQLARDF